MALEFSNQPQNPPITTILQNRGSTDSNHLSSFFHFHVHTIGGSRAVRGTNKTVKNRFGINSFESEFECTFEDGFESEFGCEFEDEFESEFECMF